MPEPTPLEIKVTREFQRKARFLAKKYRHIQTDLEPILEKLRLGETLGDIKYLGKINCIFWGLGY